MEYLCRTPSPIGALTLASDGEHLIGLWIDGQKYFAAGLGEAVEEEHLPVFTLTKKWLNVYFSGSEPGFTVPLAPKGSPFRQSVWRVLCQIPFGQVVTYGSIAQKLANGGAPSSARAVGNAVGHNPISILIPCHRVVGANGSLTGYAGGIDRKIELLRLEKAPLHTLRLS